MLAFGIQSANLRNLRLHKAVVNHRGAIPIERDCILSSGEPLDSDVEDKPGFIIGYDGKLRPTSVRCGQCGEQILSEKPPFSSSSDNLRWIQARFDLHVKQYHGRRDGEWDRHPAELTIAELKK
jgi:hypothetical protein